MDNYIETPDQVHSAFDVGNWHRACPVVELHINAATGVPWVYCPSCRCTAQLDVVSPRIDPVSSRQPRAMEEPPA